jgi:hypothetical protein
LLKNPFVLRALKILGLEEVLKLSEVLNQQEEKNSKKFNEVVGSKELTTSEFTDHSEESNSNILLFPENPSDLDSNNELIKSKVELSSECELFLLQLEFSKHNEEVSHKINALNEYKKSSAIYRVNKTSEHGKSTKKIISTNGILIDKKQA